MQSALVPVAHSPPKRTRSRRLRSPFQSPFLSPDSSPSTPNLNPDSAPSTPITTQKRNPRPSSQPNSTLPLKTASKSPYFHLKAEFTATKNRLFHSSHHKITYTAETGPKSVQPTINPPSTQTTIKTPTTNHNHSHKKRALALAKAPHSYSFLLNP